MPASGISKPAIIRSTVVLPEPDGPSMEKNSPSPMVEVDVVDRSDGAEPAREAAQRDGSPRARARSRVGFLTPVGRCRHTGTLHIELTFAHAIAGR